MLFKRHAKIESGKQGGLVFFGSLITLLMLAVVNIFTLLFLEIPRSRTDLLLFLCMAPVGGLFAGMLIVGRFRVFLHELKHSIFSNFAGNRAKELKVEQHTGHFSYEYTSSTRAYNAFIALSPYWFPLFTILGIPLSYVLLDPSERWMHVMFVGYCYGADCFLNIRDIHPDQTDLQLIRGGYLISLLYITSISIVVFTFLFAWIGYGNQGPLLLLEGLARFLYSLRDPTSSNGYLP
jgi:hypothetical protein